MPCAPKSIVLRHQINFQGRNPSNIWGGNFENQCHHSDFIWFLPNARFFPITRLFACKHFDLHRIFYLIFPVSKVPNRSNANIMIFTLVQFWPNWSSFTVFVNQNISIFGNINLLFSVVWKLTCFSFFKGGLVSKSPIRPIPNKRLQITLLWINSLTTHTA